MEKLGGKEFSACIPQATGVGSRSFAANCGEFALPECLLANAIGGGLGLLLDALAKPVLGLDLSDLGFLTSLLKSSAGFLLDLALKLLGQRGGALLDLPACTVFGLAAQACLFLAHPNVELGAQAALGLVLDTLGSLLSLTLQNLGLALGALLGFRASLFLGFSRKALDKRIQPALGSALGRL